MNLLDDLLSWFVSDTLGWLLLYAFPVVAIGIGVWLLATGGVFWGLIWVTGGILVGVIAYSNRVRQDDF